MLPIGTAIFITQETLIESASRRSDLRAVVTEGAGTRAYGDMLDVTNSFGKWLTLPNVWAMLASARVLSGVGDIRSAGDFVGEAESGRVMLIVAGKGVGGEEELNPVWADRVGDRVLLWELPDGKHTAAIDEQPGEYERRVVGFFDRLLLGR